MATSTVEKVKSEPLQLLSSRKRSVTWALALAGGLLLIAIGAVVWLQRPASAPLTVTAAAGAPDPDVPRMEVAQAKRLAASGQALLIDVRGDQYYNQLHIDGAISLPYDQVEQRLGQLPKDKWLILYCT